MLKPGILDTHSQQTVCHGQIHAIVCMLKHSGSCIGHNHNDTRRMRSMKYSNHQGVVLPIPTTCAAINTVLSEAIYSKCIVIRLIHGQRTTPMLIIFVALSRLHCTVYNIAVSVFKCLFGICLQLIHRSASIGQSCVIKGSWLLCLE